MGKITDFTVVQETITDTFHKERKPLKAICCSSYCAVRCFKDFPLVAMHLFRYRIEFVINIARLVSISRLVYSQPEIFSGIQTVIYCEGNFFFLPADQQWGTTPVGWECLC